MGKHGFTSLWAQTSNVLKRHETRRHGHYLARRRPPSRCPPFDHRPRQSYFSVGPCVVPRAQILKPNFLSMFSVVVQPRGHTASKLSKGECSASYVIMRL